MSTIMDVEISTTLIMRLEPMSYIWAYVLRIKKDHHQNVIQGVCLVGR